MPLQPTRYGTQSMTSLNLLTWNATGIMSSASYLSTALSNRDIDVCGISEHWLYEKDLSFLDCIHRDYTSWAVCDNDLVLPLFRKRAKGGVAILWKRSLDARICTVDTNDDRIIGVRLTLNTNMYMFLFQVYFPSTNYSLDLYNEYTVKLRDIHAMYSQIGIVVFMGDFNAELHDVPLGGRSGIFTDMLQDFQMLSVNARSYCKGPRATCVSYATGSETQIDHILIPVSKEDMITTCEVANDVALNVSNHRPVWLRLCIPSFCTHPPKCTRSSYNWRKADASEVDRYSVLVTQYLSGISYACENVSDLDTLYENITCGLKSASDRTIPVKGYKPYLKPYWNEQLKQLHRVVVESRNKWLADGRQRNTDSFSAYKQAKRVFRSHHRKTARLYLDQLHREVDRCAELDQRGFYKLVNERRNRCSTRGGSEMKFGLITCREPEEMANNWGGYFQQLYTPQHPPHFDSVHYDTVTETILTLTERNSTVDAFELVSSIEVEEACKELSTGKAGGHDSLTNEHLKHGGAELYNALSVLYNAFMTHGHVPRTAKQGIIITLFKGGGKPKDSPNSYRAITLIPVVAKLLERILLHRFNGLVTKFPHPLQNGFLPKMNAAMTSFVVTECARYANERNNKLYAAFLDAEKAFDRVWIGGLLWKLDNIGIRGHYWNVVHSLYTDMNSCVLYQGHSSNPFPILQGTRQGGVLSPWLFLLYINDLLSDLSNTGAGLSVGGLDCCAPTQADDITLLALSKVGLDTLLDSCYTYACKWRLTFNYIKSVVLVFNEPKNRKPCRSWKLGDSSIQEVSSTTHLGCVLTSDLSPNVNVSKACQKARGSFLGFVNCGIHGEGFHPLTSLRIYNSIVLPSALYGCEMWCNLKQCNIQALERVQHFCLKVVQGLPKRTRSDIAMGLIGVRSLESVIHQRKLGFLGALCNLRRDCVVKRLFLTRLFESDLLKPLCKQGFIPDIWCLLKTYKLENVLYNFMHCQSFPSKVSWKLIVRNNIQQREEHLWRIRLNVDQDLARYSRLQDNLKPNIWWTLSKKIPNLLRPCRTILKLCSLPPGQTRMCNACNCDTPDCIRHLLSCSSPAPRELRDQFWTSVTDQFHVNVFVSLDSLDEEDLIINLLALPDDLCQSIGPELLVPFMTLIANMLHGTCSMSFPDMCQTSWFS
jgi:hypothetical protein